MNRNGEKCNEGSDRECGANILAVLIILCAGVKNYVFQLSSRKSFILEKWLVLLEIKTRLFVMLIAATSMSASDMRFPCSLSEAYISDAFIITSSVIGRTVLAAQNLLKNSICFCAFLAFNPFRISYLAICDIVKHLYWAMYSSAFVFARLCPLNISESISVSRRQGGYISIP